MTELFAAAAAFLVVHAIAAIRPLRARLTARLGETAYIVAFSAVSVALAGWLGLAFAAAPYVELWPYHPTLRWAPLLAMPVACMLIVAGLSSRNPFSLGAGAAGYDPARPGIVAITRHPALWGLTLWAAAHIPVNGDAAALTLFGLLTVLGLAGPWSLDAKRRRALGAETWTALLHRTEETPAVAALCQIGLARMAAGAALYTGLLFLHEPVIGVSPLPVP